MTIPSFAPVTEAPVKVDVAAIDGPCGVGKSSVAREVARLLGFRHLDTGAMYRAVAWLALQKGANLKNPREAGELAASMELEIHDSPNAAPRFFCNRTDVTEAIRERAVSLKVSEAADSEPVRRALVAQQRKLGLETPSVLEGRDISTVVFPDARWKFFLEAELDIRAQRRVAQMAQSGRQVDEKEVLADLAERDRRDRIRPWGGLKIALDAVVVDTGHMSQEQVINLLTALIQNG